MKQRNWKRVTPRSLRHAMELSIQFAKEKHNLGVERIADRMGLQGHWTLYKWMESGRMPANLIRPFELACGCQFVTRYVATSAHKLLIDIPTSAPAKDTDLMALNGNFSKAVGVLAAFYQDQAEPEKALTELTSLLTEIASHRARVERNCDPELDLFGGEE